MKYLSSKSFAKLRIDLRELRNGSIYLPDDSCDASEEMTDEETHKAVEGIGTHQDTAQLNDLELHGTSSSNGTAIAHQDIGKI